VPVPHAVFGFQVRHDGHVHVQPASRDDLLPLRDRAPVRLLDGRKVDPGPCSGPGAACSTMSMCSTLALTMMRRAGRTDLIAVAIGRCCEARGGVPSMVCIPVSDHHRLN
jgi:hypothetical protein